PYATLFRSVFTPERPASAASHVLATSPPSGLVTPSPVITTWLVTAGRSSSVVRVGGRVPRRSAAAPVPRSGLRLRDVADGVAHGGEVLDLFVGDGHAELLLGDRHDGHHRERVDVEVLGEGLVRGDGVRSEEHTSE